MIYIIIQIENLLFLEWNLLQNIKYLCINGRIKKSKEINVKRKMQI